MNKQPFVPGDKVIINGYYHGSNSHLNDVVRMVLSVKRSGSTASGWSVTVDGPGYGNRNKKPHTMDAGWFKGVPKTAIEKSRTQIIDKIIQWKSEGKDAYQIDKSFQRHVTKADLINCILYLLAK